MESSDDLAKVIRERIEKLDEERKRLVAALLAIDPSAALTLPVFSGKEEGMMIPQVRVRHSKGKSKTLDAERPTSRHVVIANAAGFSLHSLGEHPLVNCTASMLSQAASGTVGMSMERARAIQKLTRSKEHPKGIEATTEFWALLRPTKS